MKIQPYYIAPLLIEQPTWGGSYITQFKSISDPHVVSKKIGQAYELAQESVLTPDFDQQNYFYATATSIDQSQKFGDGKTALLSELIAMEPEKVLGEKVFKQHGAKMPLLIKFTQALSNSYQVHVRQGKEFNHWLPKPESWYFFEKGKATLGLAPNCDVTAYQKRCREIHAFATQLSQQVVANQLELNEASQKLADHINQNHPSQFVNTVFPKTEAVIDLSQGGIHHSWETDEKLPNGNIVYEVQLDVKDEFCTLRSFDQGKFKDNGTIRDLTIDDYFTALNTDPVANDPATYFQPVKTTIDQTATIKKLFTTPYYSLTNLSLVGTYKGLETQTNESGFHHLFVKKGSAIVTANGQSFPLATGWSLFIPAEVGEYQLNTETQAELLKTTA
jgi:mannose-6-phosphate isomerase class I